MTIFVTGPERTTSKLAARLAANSLGVVGFKDWSGHGTVNNKIHTIIHKSNPWSGNILNIKRELPKIRENVKFIFCSRDKTSSKYRHQFHNHEKSYEDYMEITRDNLEFVVSNNLPVFFWNYESAFMYQENYIKTYYNFLEVKCDFYPVIREVNSKYKL